MEEKIKLKLVKEHEYLRCPGQRTYELSFEKKDQDDIAKLSQLFYFRFSKLCSKTIGNIFKNQDISINTLDFSNNKIIIDVSDPKED